MSEVERGYGCGEPGEPGLPVVKSLFTLHNMMMRVGDRLTAPIGLTSSRWMLLAAISECGDDATITDLAGVQMMSVQAISRMVVVMEEEGLLIREARPGSGRRVFLSLTEKGHEAMRQVGELGRVFRGKMFEGLTEERIVALERELSEVIENVGRFEVELGDGPDGPESEYA